MKFWETSALIPLCVEEPFSPQAKAVLGDDPEVTVWWGTPLEQASALARRVREAKLTVDGEADARAVFDRLAKTWLVVAPGAQVLERAIRLVRAHPLRAAGALHLAAALTWVEEKPAGREFVTLDRRLRDAALREGFQVLPEELPES